MLAFANMMRKGIVMPGHLMDDGWHEAANRSSSSSPGDGGASALFVDYAAVADAIGVYTVNDYAGIVDHLVQRWQVPQLRVSSVAAVEAQEYLCRHAERLRRLADLQMERRLRDRKRGRQRAAAFSWVGKREVLLQ